MPFGMKDNFWEMGDVGPCGPCSEIHFDRIGGRDAGDLVNMDDPNVVEIWNLVFIQFNREQGGELVPLPMKHIDCGLGFERLVSVIQGKESNYDTQLFTAIFDAIQKGTGARGYTGRVGREDTDGMDMAYRVVADHIRTLTIALSDGGRPDATGRGYVLRRILRRGVRYGTEKLNAKPGFFAQLVPVVIESLGTTFPELKKDPETVMEIINDEETQFLKTLFRGKKLLQRSLQKLEPNQTFPGDVAWRLYDTYGFPVDLTELIVEESGRSIDMGEFLKCKEEAQKMSGGKGGEYAGGVDLDVHAISHLKTKLNIPPTDDINKYHYRANSDNPDADYVFEKSVGVVVGLRRGGEWVVEVRTGEDCGVILDKTSFYAESGGQTYDCGYMTKQGDEETEFTVKNVQVRGGYVLHIGEVEGTIRVGDVLHQFLDGERRALVMKNHTGTHILNWALRQVLGEADQKGSLVAPDRMRFDFTSKSAMTADQVKKAEEIASALVNRNEPVYAQDVPLAKAKAVQGLRAVFGETYPDPVRVVSVGVSIDTLLDDPDGPAGTQTSIEFCGGTHLRRSGHVGKFVIATEEAISKGIRRIVALTGPEAERAINRQNHLENRVEDLKMEVLADKTAKDRLMAKELGKRALELGEELDGTVIASWKKDELRRRLKDVRKRLDDLDKEYKLKIGQDVAESAKHLAEKNADTKVLVHRFCDGANSKALDTALKQFKCPASMVFSVDQDTKKVLCLASVSKECVSKGLTAKEWMSNVCQVIGGKGGGKETTAQGTGSNLRSVDDAISTALAFASLKIGD